MFHVFAPLVLRIKPRFQSGETLMNDPVQKTKIYYKNNLFCPFLCGCMSQQCCFMSHTCAHGPVRFLHGLPLFHFYFLPVLFDSPSSDSQRLRGCHPTLALLSALIY